MAQYCGITSVDMLFDAPLAEPLGQSTHRELAQQCCVGAAVHATQGGGTLHIHFLVWLADAPPNTDAFDRAVATPRRSLLP
jgi:hypothetical protein